MTKLDFFIFSDNLFAISQLETLKISALTVDSSDLRFLSAYNNGAVVYVGSSLTVYNPLFFGHKL